MATDSSAAAGGTFPPGSTILEVRVAELKQLFNSIDASPFGHRDLDPEAEDFIVTWAQELQRKAPLAMLVHLDRPPGRPDEAALLGEAVHAFFRQRALANRRRLRNLFRVGRTSLVIGLAYLWAAVLISDLSANWIHGGVGEIFREGMAIGGWVALWRPLEIFLYNWWPIRAEAKLADRLALMPVQISYGGTSATSAKPDGASLPLPS